MLSTLCAYTTLRVQSDPSSFLSFHLKPIFCVDTASRGTAITTVPLLTLSIYPPISISLVIFISFIHQPNWYEIIKLGVHGAAKKGAII